MQSYGNACMTKTTNDLVLCHLVCILMVFLYTISNAPEQHHVSWHVPDLYDDIPQVHIDLTHVLIRWCKKPGVGVQRNAM